MVHAFFIELLRMRSCTNLASSDNVETIAHVLSVIEPALKRSDLPYLEEILYQLSLWPDGLVPDRRLEKYTEAIICRLRAKFELFNEKRPHRVHLKVAALPENETMTAVEVEPKCSEPNAEQPHQTNPRLNK
jgi:hypothetical protein